MYTDRQRDGITLTEPEKCTWTDTQTDGTTQTEPQKCTDGRTDKHTRDNPEWTMYTLTGKHGNLDIHTEPVHSEGYLLTTQTLTLTHLRIRQCHGHRRIDRPAQIYSNHTQTTSLTATEFLICIADLDCFYLSGTD